MSSLAEAMADGLERRFRQVTQALDRMAALEEREPGGGIARLSAPAAIQGAARDLVLRAHRCAADVNNFALLEAVGAEAISVEALGVRRGWGLVDLSERIQELMRAGLISYDVASDRAQLTAAGSSFVAEVEAEVQGLAGRIGDWLSGQLGGER